MKQLRKKGFTLIELLVVIGLIGLLAAVVLIAVNPARQFALGRDSQREGHVNAILNAVGQNLAENQGTFTCAGVTIPACNAADPNDLRIRQDETDLAPCIVPRYISDIPLDPQTGTWADATPATPSDYTDDTYATGYTICRDSATQRITVVAPDTEIASPDISATR